MLHQGKILIILAIFISSCQETSNKKTKQNVAILDSICHSISTKIATKIVYDTVYRQANDSINHWVKNKLKEYAGESIFSWRIDSLICFNAKIDKCLMVLPVQCTFWKDCVTDELKYFYGVKIQNKWYFFKGPSIIIPREKGKPLPFVKLHEIAMEEIFSGYLKKDDKGQWEINDNFFSDLTSGAWYNKDEFIPKTQEDWDKIYLKIVQDNWKKRDTTNYKP